MQTGAQGRESSAAFSPASAAGPGTLIVQYNTWGAPPVIPSLTGWSWSQNGGTTWTTCNNLDSCPGGACCPPGVIGAAVPFAPGQAFWSGDPAVAAGAPGQVVMINVGGDNPAGGTPDERTRMIVASISLDGGRTFPSTVRVSNLQGDCGGGRQDQPHATFDMGTSPPTLWVSWRHAGAGTFGGCVRRGQIVPTNPPTINFFNTPALTIDNMDRDDPNFGQGGILIAARTVETEQGPFTRLSAMYSNTDHIFTDCSGGKNVAWDTVTSDNLGVDWFSPVRITSTEDFGWCAASNTVQLGIREFWFAQDQFTGDYWAAVHQSPSQIGIFVSRDEGASWLGSTTINHPGRVLFHPTIAVDSSGGVAMNYWADDGGLLIQRMAVGNGSAGLSGWSSPIALTSLFTPDQGHNTFQGGDYQALTGVPPGVLPGGSSFLAAWSQSLNITTMPLALSP